MRKLVISILIALAPSGAFALGGTGSGADKGAEASGYGHGEADGRQVVGQMPASRWNDALLRAYEEWFRDARAPADAQLAAAPWSDSLAAAYRSIFPRQ